MNPDLPNPHHNPETFLDEPVYIFTGKAIVRPKPPADKQPPTQEDKPTDQPKPDASEQP